MSNGQRSDLWPTELNLWDRINELEAESVLDAERLRITNERAEKAEDERNALRAELRGLWEARISRNTPMIDTILGVPLEDILEKIICVAEEDMTDVSKAREEGRRAGLEEAASRAGRAYWAWEEGVETVESENAELKAEVERQKQKFDRLDLYLSAVPDGPVPAEVIDNIRKILWRGEE